MYYNIVIPKPEPDVGTTINSSSGMRAILSSYEANRSSTSVSVPCKESQVANVQDRIQPANSDIWEAYYLQFVAAVARRCGLSVRQFSDVLLYGDLQSESSSSSVISTPSKL